MLWKALLFTLAIVGGLGVMVVAMLQIVIDMKARALVHDGKADSNVTKALDRPDWMGDELGYDPTSKPEVLAIEDAGLKRMIRGVRVGMIVSLAAIGLLLVLFRLKS